MTLSRRSALGLIGAAGWAYMSDHAELSLDDLVSVVVPDPAPGNVTALAFTPPAPYPPAQLILSERPDLRPAPPRNAEYEPTVRDVTTYQFRDGRSLRRATVYDGATGAEPRPVIVLFHGAGRDELSMIDMWDDVADAHGLLLLSLKSEGATWPFRDNESDVIAQALSLAEADVPIDRDRLFLFGHSDGAIYAQRLANGFPGSWRAVAAHAGTLPVDWVEDRIAGAPIRHYLGSIDGIFATHDARLSAEAFAANGHHYEFQLIPQHTHWFYTGGPAIAADAWQWFETMSAADQ